MMLSKNGSNGRVNSILVGEKTIPVTYMDIFQIRI